MWLRAPPPYCINILFVFRKGYSLEALILGEIKGNPAAAHALPESLSQHGKALKKLLRERDLSTNRIHSHDSLEVNTHDTLQILGEFLFHHLGLQPETTGVSFSTSLPSEVLKNKRGSAWGCLYGLWPWLKKLATRSPIGLYPAMAPSCILLVKAF